jgi:release factor glutamine methyltransferase
MHPDSTPDIAYLRRLGREQLPGGDGAADVEVLLSAASGRSRAWLRAHDDAAAEGDWVARYLDWLQRRARGEPVAYLIGEREFWSLPLKVTPDVLIPRADTETLVEQVLERLPLRAGARLADLGTGSGAVALVVARERPQAQVVASDASSAALTVARDNAERLGLTGQVRFRLGDWYRALAGEDRFDVIASNPPYIASTDKHLGEGDLRFEPASALVSGRDGLDAIRVLVAGAASHLVSGGWLLLEHGYTQAAAVRALMQSAGLVETGSARDLGGHDRVSFARLGPRDRQSGA